MIITIAGEGWDNPDHLLGILNMLNKAGDPYTLLLTMSDESKVRGAVRRHGQGRSFGEEYVDLQVWALPEDGGEVTPERRRLKLQHVKEAVVEL